MAAELPNCGDYEGNEEMQIKQNTSRHPKSRTHPKVVVIVSATAALLGAALAVTAAPVSKTDAQIGQRMTAKSAHGSCAVIARIDGTLSPAQQKRLAALGADITRHLGFIHSVALALPTRNLGKLAALPFVSHLSYDGEVKKCDAFTDGASGAYTAYNTYGLDGTGINVAVVDSGISHSSPDLQKQIYDAVSFIPDDSSKSSPPSSTVFCTDSGSVDDVCGHGTHIAGIIGGTGKLSSNKWCTQTFYGIVRRADQCPGIGC